MYVFTFGLAARRLLTAAALTAGLFVSACSSDAPAFTGVDITGASYAQNFDLTDHNGQRRTLADFKGKAVVVFFGFTQCPDVCPTSMTELAQVKAALGADGDKLQGLFVTVDPERDTPEIMRAYMSHFDPSFLALYADDGKLEQVAKDFKIYYKKVEGPTPTSYTMDHSAGSYVYDTTGRIRLYSRYGTSVEALTQDIKYLLAGQ
jgi:protein SCO1